MERSFYLVIVFSLYPGMNIVKSIFTWKYTEIQGVVSATKRKAVAECLRHNSGIILNFSQAKKNHQTCHIESVAVVYIYYLSSLPMPLNAHTVIM